MIIVFILFLFFNTGELLSRSPGDYSGKELFIQPNSRNLSMGGSGVSFAQDNEAIYNNPAALSNSDSYSVSFIFNQWLASIRSSYISFVHPIGKNAVLGYGLQYITYGSIRHTEINESNQPVYLGQKEPYSTTILLSFGQRIDDYALGVTVKYFHQNLVLKSANTFTYDIGAQYNFIMYDKSAVAGFAIRNIDGRLRYISKSEKIPFEIVAGISVDMNDFFLVSLELNKSQDNNFGIKPAVELNFHNIVYLRAGINTLYDVSKGLSFGAGFEHNDISFNYAYVSGGKISNLNNIEISYKFGGIKKEQVAYARDKKEDGLLTLEDVYNIGKNLMLNNFPRKAIESFEKALKYKSNNPEIYKSIAECYIKINDYDSAIKYLELGLQFAEDKSEFYKLLYDLNIKLNNEAEAEKYFFLILE
jgi:tetratricopeptide (TPR) repeat protein